MDGVGSAPATVDLLAVPLTREQEQMLDILLDAYQAKHDAVTWQFLRRKLSLDSGQTEVLRSMPVVGRKFGSFGSTYGLIWSNEQIHTGAVPEDAKISLTAAGFWRAGALDMANSFIELLGLAVRKSIAFEADYSEVRQPILTSDDAADELVRARESSVSVSDVYQLSRREPPFWRCRRSSKDEKWEIWIDDSIEAYQNATGIHSYVKKVAAELTREAESNAKSIGYQEVPAGRLEPSANVTASAASRADGAEHMAAGSVSSEPKSWTDRVVLKWSGLVSLVASVAGIIGDFKGLGWLAFATAILFALFTVRTWRRSRRYLAVAWAVVSVVCILLAVSVVAKPSTTTFFYGGDEMTYPASLPYAALDAVPLTTNPATGSVYSQVYTQGASETYSFTVSCIRSGRYDNGKFMDWAHIVGGDDQNLWIPVSFLGGLDSGKAYGLLSCSSWQWLFQFGKLRRRLALGRDWAAPRRTDHLNRRHCGQSCQS